MGANTTPTIKPKTLLVRIQGISYSYFAVRTKERKEMIAMLSMTKVVFERFPVFKTDCLTNRSGKQSGLIIDHPITSLCVSDFEKNPVMSIKVAQLKHKQ